MTLSRQQRNAIGAALGAAALFGVTVPLAKQALLGESPWLIAGLLYLGSGIGLGVLAIVQRRRWTVARTDLPWLAAAILSGGIIAPVLLMLGLGGQPASGASLLLVTEGVFTSVIAWCVFRENVDRRVLLGFLAVTAGTILLFAGPAQHGVAVVPALYVLGACLGWAIDNTLTRKVALADAVQLAALKGLIAGVTNASLAIVLGARWPGAPTVAYVGLLGFLGYGASLVLFVVALRSLGAARTSAYFASGPFVGAVAAILLLAEPVTAPLVGAGLLMLIGVWLHVTESHTHEHEHEEVVHDHFHEHDDHHRHHPDGSAVPPHAHSHRHDRSRHRHGHFPDAHHSHDH